MSKKQSNPPPPPIGCKPEPPPPPPPYAQPYIPTAHSAINHELLELVNAVKELQEKAKGFSILVHGINKKIWTLEREIDQLKLKTGLYT